MAWCRRRLPAFVMGWPIAPRMSGASWRHARVSMGRCVAVALQLAPRELPQDLSCALRPGYSRVNSVRVSASSLYEGVASSPRVGHPADRSTHWLAVRVPRARTATCPGLAVAFQGQHQLRGMLFGEGALFRGGMMTAQCQGSVAEPDGASNGRPAGLLWPARPCGNAPGDAEIRPSRGDGGQKTCVGFVLTRAVRCDCRDQALELSREIAYSRSTRLTVSGSY